MLVFSLTTIPPRFDKIHKTLDSLLQQNMRADEIVVNIPRSYRRFQNMHDVIPSFNSMVTVNFVEEDFGPATKILPVISRYRNKKDVRIIFCDDDRAYDSNWSRRFVDCARSRPDECIVEAGWELSQISEFSYTPVEKPRAVPIRAPRSYIEKKIRKLFRRKAIFKSSGYVDILGGCCGALVKPEFFDDDSFAIPEILWTVDDVWLSGCLRRNKVRIWANAKGRDAVRTEADPVDALFDYTLSGVGRNKANSLAIAFFRENYGFWK